MVISWPAFVVLLKKMPEKRCDEEKEIELGHILEHFGIALK